MKDPLLEDAKKFILETRQVSVSALQRHFQIGFNRGVRIIDQLEEKKFISKTSKGEKWEILEE